jgi:hypothetical protein
MAGTFTAVGEALALDYMFDAAAVTRPTTWFMALHVGANGGAGAANEVVGNGYARQAVTYTRSGNVMSNSTATAFGPDVTANWGSVTDITVWDAVTAGRCLAQGTAAAAVSYSVGDTATVAIGAHTITLT